MDNTDKQYLYTVSWSDEDKEYVGTVRELPGLSWLDSSPEKALNGIRKVTYECVADMLRLNLA